jgi:hypothetical protein
MNKLVSRFFVTAFLLFFHIVISGQTNMTVAEKVYLHIDRVLYNSGDDIWFKAYVIDPSTNKLSVNTNNLHVELIAPDSKIILSHIIRIEGGVGNGDFHLADSVPSGQYHIRAYTNYMRNYDEHLFFQKEITVVSPYDEGSGFNKPKKLIDNKIDITFFPEGGSLVDNVASKVAFKAVNALGKGCDVALKLYSPSGDLITTFNSKHLGMGFFNIKPVPGFIYYTVVQSNDGTEIKTSLPQSFPTGVAIRTQLTQDKKLILTISTNETTLPLLADRNLSVNLSSRNLVNITTSIKITSLINNFLIPLDSIPDGIIRVTLSGTDGLPLCERLVFLQKKGDVRLIVTTDKTEYKPREKVNTEISLSGDSAFTGAGEFSFSAAEERFTNNSSHWPASITSWFLLESDIRGIIEEPSYYFDPDNKNRLQDLDLLLLTQGWRDFKWKYDSLSTFNHELGFSISGKVTRIVNNNPIEDAKINLGLFSEDSKQFQQTKTDRYGSYKFENLLINGITEAIMSSTDKFENAQGRISVDPVKYEPPLIEKIQPDTIELSLITKDYSSLKHEAIIKLNTLKKYKLSDTLNLGEVFITAKRAETVQEIKVKESRRVYGNPDRELEISKAVENYGGDVFSFLSGRIAGVQVVRGQDPKSIYYPDDADVFIRGQFIIEKVNYGGKQITIKRGALILLDGYEVNQANLSSILTLPMNIIDRIDILYASPLYGMRGANGVVNIITRTGIRRAPETVSPNSTYVIVKGFDVLRIFYSPNYDNKKEQTFLPDYRTTIFWEPNIKIDKKIKSTIQFFNADNPTKISVVVEGITKEGIPVTGKTSYEVK